MGELLVFQLNDSKNIFLALIIAGIVGSGAAFYNYGFLFLILAASVIVLSIADFMNGRETMHRIWIFFIGFPFFLNVGGPGIIGLGSSVFNKLPGQTIPFSFFIMIWLILLISMKKILAREAWLWTPMTKQYGILFGLFFVIALIGLFFSHKPTDLLFIFQIVSPFLVYVLITNYVNTKERYLESIRLMVTGTVLGLVLLLVSNALNYGASTIIGPNALIDKVFFFNVYQIYDYYPVALAAVAILLFAIAVTSRSLFKKTIMFILFMLTVLVLTKLNARNAFLVFAIGFPTLIIFSSIGLKLKLWLSVVGIGMMIFLLNLNLPVFERFGNADVSVRSVRMQEGLYQVYQNPLLGSMFQSDLITGYHNQYLELAGSAGLPITIAFFSLILLFLIRTVKFIKRTEDKQLKIISSSIICVIIAILLGSNIAQSNFTQPLTAFLIWFLIGCQDALNYMSSKKQKKKNQFVISNQYMLVNKGEIK